MVGAGKDVPRDDPEEYLDVLVVSYLGCYNPSEPVLVGREDALYHAPAMVVHLVLVLVLPGIVDHPIPRWTALGQRRRRVLLQLDVRSAPGV